MTRIVITRWSEPVLSECMAGKAAEQAEARGEDPWDTLEATMIHYLGRGARVDECAAAYNAVVRYRLARMGG